MTVITFASVCDSNFCSSECGENPVGRKANSEQEVVEKHLESEVGFVSKFPTRLIFLLAKGEESLVIGNEEGDVVSSAKMERKGRRGADEIGHCCTARGGGEDRLEGGHGVGWFTHWHPVLGRRKWRVEGRQ